MRLATAWIVAISLGLAIHEPSIAQVMPDGWRFVLDADGAVVPCSVVREGPVQGDPKAVNTRVVRNKDNRIVLTAARPDWRLNPDFGLAEVELVVDNAPALELEGYPLGPLLMTVVEDAELTRRLRSAQTVKWILPWGEFQATVTGLGPAFDRTTLCSE